MSEFFGLLFARPSFLEGASRAFDIGGTLNEYNRLLTPAQADLHAIRSDIAALRKDYEAVRKQAAEDVQERDTQLSLF